MTCTFSADGTTDAGNFEDEMIVIQFFLKDSEAKEVKSCACYLTIFNPDKADADGLVNGLKIPLEKTVFLMCLIKI